MTTPSPSTGAPSPVDSTAPGMTVTPDTSQQDMRDMVSQLLKPPYPFDPATFKTGVVTGFNINTGQLTVTLSGDNTQITGVTYHSGYGPTIGDVVNIAQQGTQMVVVDKVSAGNAFQALSLINGYTGNVWYRLYSDQGSQRMQFTGQVNCPPSAFIIGTLPVGFRPASQKNCLGAREWQTGACAVTLTFNTDGSIWANGLVGGYTTSSGGDHAHFHYHEHQYYNGSGWADTINGPHSQDGNSGPHAHGWGPVQPAWVSFEGVQFYL